jgi:hypothetical protein
MRPVSAGLLLLGLAFGQPPQGRDELQDAYQHWRQADPALERDATSAAATLGARADKVSAEAAKYFALRKVYLESLATDAGRKASALEAVSIAPDAAGGLENHLNAQRTIVESGIQTIGRGPDRGIQQLLQSYEREREAINAISAAMKDNRNIQQALVEATTSAEQKRAQISESYQKLGASFEQSAQLAEQSGAAWTSYYRALSNAARSAPAPVTSIAPVRPPNTPEPGAAVPNSASAAARSVSAIPLSRYVGSWSFPVVGGLYHGAQPQSVEMEVREENGRANGTLFARFRLPPGVAGDPLVKFSFEGPFGNSRTQKLVVTTSNGARGLIELIPGPAFNLLEVNFSTYDKPGMVRAGNFLLVKK